MKCGRIRNRFGERIWMNVVRGVCTVPGTKGRTLRRALILYVVLPVDKSFNRLFHYY